MYSYDVIPVKDGFSLNSLYRIRLDARTGRIYGFRQIDGCILTESFKKSEVIINHQPNELKPLVKTDMRNVEEYNYIDTMFIYSILSKDYQLVHQYVNEDGQKIYINTMTGNEEFLY